MLSAPGSKTVEPQAIRQSDIRRLKSLLICQSENGQDPPPVPVPAIKHKQLIAADGWCTCIRDRRIEMKARRKRDGAERAVRGHSDRFRLGHCGDLPALPDPTGLISSTIHSSIENEPNDPELD